MNSSYSYCFLVLLFFPLSSPPISASSDVVSQPNFQNDRLRTAYVALQAWKKAIHSDPQRMTANWVGPNVCSYNGVFCAPALDSPSTTVVGVDLNHGGIAGFLPPELGTLADVAVIHLNSNQFSGVIPQSFDRLKLLFELDVSNNRLVGPFPTAILELTSLRFLDLRYNDFQGPLPPKLFDMALDALFLNNNRFDSKLPPNFGILNASVVVLSNNNFSGCIPSSIGKMSGTINEILLSNNKFRGCLPPEMAQIESATVIDIGGNQISGHLFPAMGRLVRAEEIDVSGNNLVGEVPDWLCNVGSLRKLEIQRNFFDRMGRICGDARRRGVVVDDRRNCLPDLANQRAGIECREVIGRPVVCNRASCGGGASDSLVEATPPSATTAD